MGVAAIVAMAVAIDRRESVLHKEDMHLEAQTREVLSELETIMHLVVDSQSSTRGYVITGQEATLEPYRAAQARLDGTLRQLQTLTADNPKQQQQLAELERLAAGEFEFRETLIRTQREQGIEAARQLMLTGTGAQQVEAIRSLVADMQAEEERLLSQLQERSEQSRRQSDWAQALLVALAMAAVAGSFLVIRRHLLSRAEAEQRLHQRTAELEAANIHLQESKGALAKAQSLARVGSWELDLVKNELRWSDEIYRMFEIDKARFGATYEAFLNAIHPDDREKVNKAYTDSLVTRLPYRIVHRLLMADGRIKWVEERCESEFNAKGKPLRSVGTVQDITELKLHEEALRAQEQRFSAIFENVTGIIFHIALEPDGKLRFLSVNQAFLDVTGLAKHQVVGKLIQEVIPKPALGMVLGKYREAIETRKTVRWEEESVYPAGKRHGLVAITPTTDVNGTVTSLIGIVTDITERKKAEEALRLSNERFEVAMRASNEGLWDLDIATSASYMSPRWKEIVGYRDDELPNVASSFFDLIHPDDKGRVNAAVQRHLEQDAPLREEFRLRHKNGAYRWVSSRGLVVRDAAGRPLRMVGSTEDITERKRADEELRVKDNAIATSINAVAITNVDGRIDYVNPMFVRMWGYGDESEVLGKTPMDFTSDPAEAQAIVQAMMEKGFFIGDLTGKKKDGSLFPAEISASVVTDGAGRVTHLMASFVDITERKRVMAALRESEARLDEAQRIAHLGSWEWIAATGTPTWSKELCAILDVDPTEPVPTVEEQHKIYTPASMKAMTAAIAKAMNAGESYEIELERVWENGASKWLLARGEPWFDENRHLIGLRGTALDITERKVAERKILEALREKEVLLREIHHRVKNNLQIISSLLYLQSQKIKDPGLLELFHESRNRVASMALIHEQLYQSNDLAQVDFSTYTSALANSLFHSYGTDRSRIALDIGMDAHTLDINTAIPCGLIMNEVISNALKYAFPGGREGTITVKMRREGEKYHLDVIDDGVGMPPHGQGFRKGSLGMQLIDRLVAQINGTLAHVGPPGTAYRITFPAIGTNGR